MQSASVVATISPVAAMTPSFRAPPTFLLVWMKTLSAYFLAISQVASFDPPSTTIISYSLRGTVWCVRETRHWAIFSSSLKVGMMTEIMTMKNSCILFTFAGDKRDVNARSGNKCLAKTMAYFAVTNSGFLQNP